MAECVDGDEKYFILQRIEAQEALILRIETALVTVSAGATSYTIDTGQTRQTVTKATPGELRNALNEALNLRSVLKAQLEGKSVNLRPGW